MKKIDWKARAKNYMTWIGFISILFISANIQLEDLTSWNVLFNSIMDILKNPFLLMNTTLALCSVICDTSTKGMTDKEHITVNDGR